MAAQLFSLAPDPEAKLYYTTMVQDESRHTEAWLRLVEEAGGRGEPDPYLDQLAEMQLKAESIEEKVFLMQVFYERLIIPRFRLIARSSKGTVLEDLCNRLSVDDGIHHGSGMAYAKVLLTDAPTQTKRRLIEGANRMLPIFVQHALWRPKAREFIGSLMRGTDERRLREDLDQGVRLAQSLGLEVSVVDQDLEPYAKATEALTGVAPVPVAVVGPIDLELGEYELEEPQGRLLERRRAEDSVYVPLANTEGGLSISLARGARAASESGGFRTHVLRDRITRASAFLFETTADAATFARWIETRVPDLQEWLAGAPVEGLSRHAKLREVETHVVGPMCHVLYAYTTGDAVGMNMITRNSYALNQVFVLERAPVKPRRVYLEGNMGGDKKISHRYFESGGHGKTVIAECTLTEDAVRRVLHTSIDDLLDLTFVGTHGAVASGMQSVAFTPATAI